MTLPAGWTIDEEEQKLPPGWTVEESPSTPRERDEAKLKKEAGKFLAPEKTKEELDNMSISEQMEYNEALKREREYLRSSQFSKGALSGLTFGATENIEALKPIEFEENNPYKFSGLTGQVSGSFLPLSKMIKWIGGPALKLASKSPIFQKQIGSLLTMFGVGAADEALHSVAKGEVPSAEEVLDKGIEWAALDAILQSTGALGRFAKGLFSRSKQSGLNRKQIINDLNQELKDSGIDFSDAEAVSAKALEILEKPITESERALALAQPAETSIEQVAEQTLNASPIKPQELKTKKISDEPVNRLTSEAQVLAEPYQPEGINFVKESDNLAKDAVQEQIDSIGTRAATEEDLGNSIREDIETQLKEAKESYAPLYDQAEEAAQTIMHSPENAAKEAGNKLTKMSQLKTKPAGYESVLRTLENVLEDAGYIIQRDEHGKIDLILSATEVPVEKTIELARRLNEIIDYEAIEPSVKDALKSVKRGAKQDIRIGLAKNPDALSAFELAEQEHARIAEKFNRKSIKSIRENQAGEKISKMTEAPSTLGDLKEVLSPEQMMQVEREMLQKLNNQTHEKAQKSLRELERHLSSENRKLAREIVESKNPHNPVARKKLTQEAILNDMSNSLTNGTRPNKTLELWKTPKGQKLVKETFNNSPNWPQVKKYLENQSFNDMVSSILKENGTIDLKKYQKFIRDPAMVNNIRNQGGEEAVQFFKELDSKVNQFQRNTNLLEKLPKKGDQRRGKEILKRFSEKTATKPKITKLAEKEIKSGANRLKESKGNEGSKILKRMISKDFPIQAKVKKWRELFTETMGLNEKGLLSVFGLMKLGLPNTVVSLVGYRIFNKLLTSSTFRRAFNEAAKYQSNPLKYILAIENMGELMEQE